MALNNKVKRWLPWVAFVTVFVLGTSLLSWWQFARREERVQLIEQVLENYEQPAVSLDELFSGEDWNESFEWRMVKLTGKYLTDDTHLVRNRPLAGTPGFLVLVPFRLEDGTVIAIERGWLPTGAEQDAPDLIPTITQPEKTIEVRLRAGEPDLNRDPVPGQLASIDLVELADRISNDSLELEFYGRVAAESPAEELNPAAMPAPSLSEGNHLSYAMQWILFGVMALGALIWAIRSEQRSQAIAAGATPKARTRKTKAEIDADAEDAWVDGLTKG